VSKVKELELRLAHAEAQLRLHQSISRFLAKVVNLPEALNSVLTMVAEFTHADSCLLYLFTQGELVLCAAHGPNPAAVGEVRLRLEEGLTGWVARERRLLAISREAYHDPRFKYFSSLPEDTFEAFLSVPILTRNRVVGVINLQHRQPHSHSGEEMEMLTMVGQQVGALITLASLDAEKFAQLDFAELVLGARVGAPES
jgi:uroporphyrinogen-III synthase